MKNLILLLVALNLGAYLGSHNLVTQVNADSGNSHFNHYSYNEALDLCVNERGVEGYNLAVGECGNFINVNLSGRDFSGLSLRGANFTGATLEGVNFSGSDLMGAKFDENFVLPIDVARIEEINILEMEMRSLETQVLPFKKEIQRVRIKIVKLESKKNPNQVKIEKLRAKVRELRMPVKMIKGKISVIRNEIEELKFI